LWERILNGEIVDPFELAAAELDDIAAALNAQAGVVEALRPLAEALARHDKAALADDHANITVAAHDLFDAARAALAAVREKGRE
jgi:predicted RNA-binding Zn ribbon-like protein